MARPDDAEAAGKRLTAFLAGTMYPDAADFYTDLRFALSRIASLEVENTKLEASLAVVRQSLEDQASARLDPTMPLLTPEVLEVLKADAEASYALAETRQERVAAHGLSLICDWQDKARALLPNVKPDSEEG